jgi:phage/plasmid-associated DNA primase
MRENATGPGRDRAGRPTEENTVTVDLNTPDNNYISPTTDAGSPKWFEHARCTCFFAHTVEIDRADHWVVGLKNAGTPGATLITGIGSDDSNGHITKLTNLVDTLDNDRRILVGYCSDLRNGDLDVLRSIVGRDDRYKRHIDLRHRTPTTDDVTPTTTNAGLPASRRVPQTLETTAAKLLVPVPIPLSQVDLRAPNPDHNNLDVLQTYCNLKLNTIEAILAHCTPELTTLASLSALGHVNLLNTRNSGLAERILRRRHMAKYGHHPIRVKPPDYVRYTPPAYIRRPRHPELTTWYDTIISTPIPVADGKAQPPVPTNAIIGGLELTFGSARGGLHSVNQPAIYRADDTHTISNLDIASFYPSIVLNAGVVPAAFKPDDFLPVVTDLLQRRLDYKANRSSGQYTDTKIALNSIYGKYGSPHSGLYDPAAALFITVTGVLALLNLLEDLVDCGVVPLLVNTDGIYIQAPVICNWHKALGAWSETTGFEVTAEPVEQLLVGSVNDVATLSPDGTIKRAGRFRVGTPNLRHKPAAPIVADAVISAVFHNTPPEDTVVGCTDTTRFLFTSTISGGEEFDGHWYLAGKLDSNTTKTRVTDPHTDIKPNRSWYAGAARTIIIEDYGAYLQLTDPALLTGETARHLHDLGLTPCPKYGKASPKGTRSAVPSYLWSWELYETYGTHTKDLLVVDVDVPELFGAWMKTQSERPNYTGFDPHTLVSYHPDGTPERARAGQCKCKLIFKYDKPINLAYLKRVAGIDLFRGSEVPTILGKHPDGPDREYLLTVHPAGPPPQWLLDAVTYVPNPTRTTASTETVPDYCARTLKEQVHAVKSCSDERHKHLYRAARTLGSLLHTNIFAEDEVVAALLNAAHRDGDDKIKTSKHRSTVKAAIKKGKANPAPTAHLGAHEFVVATIERTRKRAIKATKGGVNDATRIVKATLVHQLGGNTDYPKIAYFRQGWWEYTNTGWVQAPDWEEKPLVDAVYAEQDRHNEKAIKDHKAKLEALRKTLREEGAKHGVDPDATEIKIVEQAKKLKLQVVTNPAVVRAIRWAPTLLKADAGVSKYMHKQYDPGRAEDDYDTPFWVGGRLPDDPDPRNLIVVANGHLNYNELPNPVLRPLAPRLFTPVAFTTRYEPTAPRPRLLESIPNYQFGMPTTDATGAPLIDRDGKPLKLKEHPSKPGVLVPDLKRGPDKRYIIPYSADGFPMVVLGDDGEPLPEDKEAKTAVYNFLALCLTSITRFHKFGLWVGAPRSGRSTLLRVFTALVGYANIATLDIKDIDDKFGMEQLPHKSLTIISDMRPSDKYESNNYLSFLLRSPGGDAVTINEKYKKRYPMTLRTKILILSNRVPAIKDDTSALLERTHPVHFPRQVPELLRDTLLTDNIIGRELPGFLNLLLDHLHLVLTQHPMVTFKAPESARFILDKIRSHSHPLIAFLDECTDRPEPGAPMDYDLIVYTLDLYHAYRAWKSKNGEDHTVGLTQFHEQILAIIETHNLNIKYQENAKVRDAETGKRKNDSRRWAGLRLKAEWRKNMETWRKQTGTDAYVDGNRDRDVRNRHDVDDALKHYNDVFAQYTKAGNPTILDADRWLTEVKKTIDSLLELRSRLTEKMAKRESR